MSADRRYSNQFKIEVINKDYTSVFEKIQNDVMKCTSPKFLSATKNMIRRLDYILVLYNELLNTCLN